MLLDGPAQATSRKHFKNPVHRSLNRVYASLSLSVIYIAHFCKMEENSIFSVTGPTRVVTFSRAEPLGCDNATGFRVIPPFSSDPGFRKTGTNRNGPATLAAPLFGRQALSGTDPSRSYGKLDMVLYEWLRRQLSAGIRQGLRQILQEATQPIGPGFRNCRWPITAASKAVCPSACTQKGTFAPERFHRASQLAPSSSCCPASSSPSAVGLTAMVVSARSPMPRPLATYHPAANSVARTAVEAE